MLLLRDFFSLLKECTIYFGYEIYGIMNELINEYYNFLELHFVQSKHHDDFEYLKNALQKYCYDTTGKIFWEARRLMT